MGRPRQHSHDDFVDAAIRIIDAEGLACLTARRLGRELGVSYTAIYTYFNSLEDLMGALVGRVSAEVVSGITVRGETVRDELVAVAVSARRALARHPQLAAVFVTASNEASQGNDATRYVVGLLEQAGLSGGDLVTAYRIIESYVLGSTVFDLGAAPQHVSIRRRRYAAIGHPDFTVVATSDASIEAHNEESFERGITLILAGLGI